MTRTSSQKQTYCYAHPRPAATVDLVVLRKPGPEDMGQAILLIRRANDPFAEQWALPGGYVDQGESPEEAARRELHEETKLRDVNLQQIGAFGEPGRDPRGWVISIAYLGHTLADVRLCAGDDAAEARWWSLSDLPSLAFDHNKIVKAALELEKRLS